MAEQEEHVEGENDTVFTPNPEFYDEGVQLDADKLLQARVIEEVRQYDIIYDLGKQVKRKNELQKRAWHQISQNLGGIDGEPLCNE